VTVFSDNVHQTSFELEISPEMLLGHVIAHEIEHMLLRSSHHSLGIMNAPWSRTDYYWMKRGVLDFSAADKAAVRRAAQERSHPSPLLSANEASALLGRFGRFVIE
jgi:hypothetical protein